MRLFKAEYKGFPCEIRLVEDRKGENVVTVDGNVYAREGDYVALNVDKAPRGFRSDRIDRVVRAKDKKLVVGEEIKPEQEEEPEETPTLDDFENDNPNPGPQNPDPDAERVG